MPTPLRPRWLPQSVSHCGDRPGNTGRTAGACYLSVTPSPWRTPSHPWRVEVDFIAHPTGVTRATWISIARRAWLRRGMFRDPGNHGYPLPEDNCYATFLFRTHRDACAAATEWAAMVVVMVETGTGWLAGRSMDPSTPEDYLMVRAIALADDARSYTRTPKKHRREDEAVAQLFEEANR